MKGSGSARSICWKRARRSFRKLVVGTTIKKPPMRCVPRRMPRITDIFRSRISFRLLSATSGLKKSEAASRNCGQKSWNAIKQNTIFHSTMRKSLPPIKNWRIFSRRRWPSVKSRRRFPTGLWWRPCVS